MISHAHIPKRSGFPASLLVYSDVSFFSLPDVDSPPPLSAPPPPWLAPRLVGVQGPPAGQAGEVDVGGPQEVLLAQDAVDGVFPPSTEM